MTNELVQMVHQFVLTHGQAVHESNNNNNSKLHQVSLPKQAIMLWTKREGADLTRIQLTTPKTLANKSVAAIIQRSIKKNLKTAISHASACFISASSTRNRWSYGRTDQMHQTILS
jgi:hypothetical protein